MSEPLTHDQGESMQQRYPMGDWWRKYWLQSIARRRGKGYHVRLSSAQKALSRPVTGNEISHLSLTSSQSIPKLRGDQGDQEERYESAFSSSRHLIAWKSSRKTVATVEGHCSVEKIVLLDGL